MLLKYVEFFYSIQGEGPNLGRPAIFLRLKGCNLNCQFSDSRCDTFLLNVSSEEYNSDPKALVSKLRKKFPFFDKVLLVITGGEPLLKQEALQLFVHEVLKTKSLDTIEIETNGTIFPTIFKHKVRFIVSPKIATQPPQIKTKVISQYLDRLKKHPKKVFFKFVVDTESDVRKILSLDARFRIYRKNVYLMPVGHSRDLVLKNSLKVVELSKKYHFNFSSRLQIMLWDTKRGV